MGSTSSTGRWQVGTGRSCATTPSCVLRGTTPSSSTRRGRASSWPTIRTRSCATRCSPGPTPPRPSGWLRSHKRLWTGTGPLMKKWLPVPPAVTPLTPGGSASHGGSLHELHGPLPPQPARRLCFSALPHSGGRAAAGRCWGGSGGHALALRRGGGRGGRAPSRTGRGGERELCRVAVLLPRGAGGGGQRAPLPLGARASGGGGRCPGDRQLERDDAHGLGPLRPPDAKRRRVGHRAQRVLVASGRWYLWPRSGGPPCGSPRPGEIGGLGAGGGEAFPLLQLGRGGRAPAGRGGGGRTCAVQPVLAPRHRPRNPSSSPRSRPVEPLGGQAGAHVGGPVAPEPGHRPRGIDWRGRLRRRGQVPARGR